MPESVPGVFGVIAIFAIAVALSTNRKAIRLRVVGAAFMLQLAIAILVLYVDAGRAVISTMSEGVANLLSYSGAGISMVFGSLAAEGSFSFVINVLPVVIFFASLMAVLYHLGLMQFVVAGIGKGLNRLLGTGPVESLNAAANIFVGQTEAPLVVKPYLQGITQPQLFAIMTSGLASVAGAVLAAYAQLGVSIEYLLAASFMSAPGGLLMAKLIMPDGLEDAPARDLLKVDDRGTHHSNVIMAAAMGARDGLMLAANIAAMLLAFVSLIALLNGLLGWLGNLVGLDNLSVQLIMGWLFAPLMYLLSVPWSEAVAAGGIVGEKIIVNEFVAYLSFVELMEGFHPRTQAVLTFALCGFANLSSIGILLGGLGSLVPERMGDIARFGLRAVAAGTLANLMSAAIAGLLFAG